MTEQIYRRILEAICELLNENIAKEEITIYISPIIKRYIEDNHTQTFNQSFNKKIELKIMHGVKVVNGYDWENIVVSWDLGEYYQRRPIIIQHTIKVTRL